MPLTKIQSLGITDGTIVNADINASAAIAGTKLSGAGKVLQVVTATDDTARSTSSTTYVTGSNTLSVAITPSSASNKILIFCSSSIQNATAGAETNVTVFRDSTNLAGTGSFTYGYHISAYESNSLGISYLDSPNTTSSITYQVYFRTTSGGTAGINIGNIGNRGSITAFEIAV
jgi:hypothetical protein